MRKTTRTIATAVVAASVAAGFVFWQGHIRTSPATKSHSAPSPHRQRHAAVSVKMAVAEKRTVPITLASTGRVVSAHVVQIVPQVSGILKRVYFNEGDRIRKGQKLFEIDPAPFQAAVEQAVAALRRDRAALANDRWQERHLAPLAKKDYVTPQEYRNARSSVAQQSATVAADLAQLKTARMKLGYTTIRSPISARAGVINVKSGNLVASSSANPLVTLRQISPIQVAFTLPQQRLGAVQKAYRRSTVAVDINNPHASGRLVFIDNQVDQNTGTVSLRASFANRKRLLWPGEYVTLSLRIGRIDGAVTIPETAVQQGQSGPFVYVIDNGKAQERAVSLGIRDGDSIVIKSGLAAGERVITEVPNNLRDGSAVKPIADTKARGRR